MFLISDENNLLLTEAWAVYRSLDMMKRGAGEKGVDIPEGDKGKIDNYNLLICIFIFFNVTTYFYF